MSHVIASVSMLKEVEKCSTAAYLKSLGLGIATNQVDKAPLFAGQCAHKLLELWLKGESNDSCLNGFITAYRPYSDKFIESDNQYHSGNLERILDHWLLNHPLNAFPYTMVNAEYVRRAPLSDHEVSDISDGILADKTDGTLWALEWKTSSKEPQKVLAKEMTNPQITQHIYVCRANGFNVAGVLLGAIQFNQIPQPTKYLCRLKEHKGVRLQDCWHRHIRGGFFPITKSPEQLQDWGRNASSSLGKYYDVAQAAKMGIQGVSIIAQEGLIGERCDWCDYKQFCQGNRKNFDMLTPFEVSDRSDIIHSGLVED